MGVGARPWYSAARASKANSSAPHTSQRNCGSSVSACFCASPRKAWSGWPSKRHRIALALILERLPVKAEQDRVRLDLGALAVRRLDLEGAARLLQDGADAESAIFLEEQL